MISMMKGVANSTPTRMPWANSLMVIPHSPRHTARSQDDQGRGSQGGWTSGTHTAFGKGPRNASLWLLAGQFRMAW
jgi:hypothetical protein